MQVKSGCRGEEARSSEDLAEDRDGRKGWFGVRGGLEAGRDLDEGRGH